MTFDLLDAESDARSWQAALGDLPESLRDVYYDAAYVALHRLVPGMRARLAVFREGGETWLYPFIQQPIDPTLASGEEGLCDLESPYGYSGPVSTSSDPAFLKRAHAAFRSEARGLRAVAEFIRFHPLLATERWADPAVEVLVDRETRSIRLPAEGDVLDAFSGKARSMVRRAEGTGLRVSQPSMTASSERFADLYRQNMERLHADEYFYFRTGYFAGLATLADRDGFLLVAELDGQWNAAAVFLYGADVLHYHLAAASVDQRIPGVANLLIAEAARRAQARGVHRLHLGGGRTADPEDSLLKFKAAMGAEAHTFRIGKRILDRDRYEALKERWASEHPDLVQTYGHRILCYRYGS